MYLRHARCVDAAATFMSLHPDDIYRARERCAACPHHFNGECEADARASGNWGWLNMVIDGKTRDERNGL